MKKLISTLILLLLINFCNSQSMPYSREMVVFKAELQQQKYQANTTANALILYEEGNGYVHKISFKLTTKITKKIKIFNRKGIDHATITIPIFQDAPSKISVTDVKGVTYNLEDDEIKRTNLEENSVSEIVNIEKNSLIDHKKK